MKVVSLNAYAKRKRRKIPSKPISDSLRRALTDEMRKKYGLGGVLTDE